MDIDRIRYFHIFSETGSLVKASEILHISQPALSKALRLLEVEVGYKLLEQDGRGLKLTPKGIYFINTTKSLIEEWVRLPDILNNTPSVNSIKIGSFEVFTTYFLKHLSKYQKLENLMIYEYTPGKLEESLTNGIIDIGITYTAIPKESLDIIEVGKIEMGVYGLKKFSTIQWEALPFVIPISSISGTPTKVVGLDGWPDHKFKRNISFQVTLMESALELLRNGQAVAYLPKFIVNLHNQYVLNEFKFFEIDSPIKRKDKIQSVYLLKRKSQDEDIIFRNIAKALRELN